MSRLNNLYKKMVEFYRGDPARIQHFVKVHSFAKLIGEEEHIDEKTLYILEAAAYVHDIGIRISMEKYGKQNGMLQEQEGPAEAEKMMKQLGFDPDVIERVSYLVGHHHSYAEDISQKLRILMEADFLVNAYEDSMSENAMISVRNKLFRSKCGTRLLNEIFDLEE